MSAFTKILPEWQGEDVFILCGGTSVTSWHLGFLQGKKVIAVNTMYALYPQAQCMFFGDRWWYDNEKRVRPGLWKDYPGTKYTVQVIQKEPNLYTLNKVGATGLATAKDAVVCRRTSAISAMNIAYHKGAKRIILLGVDNRPGENGRVHCHMEYNRKGSILPEDWNEKAADFIAAAEFLKDHEVTVVNCSPISDLTCFPKCDLLDVIVGAPNVPK